MAKILVTGANGYIGTHVVGKALDEGHEVIVADIRFDNVDNRAIRFTESIFSGDTNIYKKAGSPDVLIHLAWQDGFVHNSDSHLANLYTHYTFLKNMIDSGCKSISVMGSMHEVGYWEGEINANTPCKPLSLYGVSKNSLRQALEVYTADKEVSLKWLRAFYITGDDEKSNSIFNKILKMSNEGKKSFPFTTGLNKYDFIDIEELALQIIQASLQNDISGTINCCSGNPVSLKDKVQEFIKTHKLDIQPEFGVYPTRRYDSPAIWGNVNLIKKIMGEYYGNLKKSN